MSSDLHKKGIGAMRKSALVITEEDKNKNVKSPAQHVYPCALTHLRNAAYRYLEFANNNNKLCT